MNLRYPGTHRVGTGGDYTANGLDKPRCLGEVTPAYGYRAVTPGEDVACAAPRNASDGVDAYACVGWCVYTNTSDSSGWVACEEGAGTSLNLSPYANTTTRLVWRWLRSVEQSPAQEPIADDAYCRVAYVGSASQEFKQYVDTKIGVGPDVALDVDFRLWKLPSGSTANDRFRCGWAGVDEQFNFGVIPDRTGYGDVFMASMSGKGANQFQFSGVKVDLLRHRVVIRSGEQKVDASVAATEANFVDPKVGNRGTLYLFATHTVYTAVGDIAAYMPMDVYACTINSGDDCHELIPCRRRADNVGGFYDTFTGEFLGLGSGWGSSGILRVGEDCVTAESVLKVEGDPLAYGEVIPAYGHIGPLTPGQTIRCSAPLVAADGYTLTASVDLDEACRAAVDYVGLWYLFGDPLKPQTTENDLQERASIAVAVDHEKISIPIPVGLTDGTGFWQFRAYNVADDGTTNFITRTLMDQVPIQDSSTYTWTGAGNTAAWSDAENWTGGVSGMWPFSTGAKIVFAAGSCDGADCRTGNQRSCSAGRSGRRHCEAAGDDGRAGKPDSQGLPQVDGCAARFMARGDQSEQGDVCEDQERAWLGLLLGRSERCAIVLWRSYSTQLRSFDCRALTDGAKWSPKGRSSLIWWR